MKLSIIIVSYNSKDYTRECIESIREFGKGIEYEIIVVDNASGDGSCEYLSNLSKQNSNIVLVKKRENVGFAKANNIGIHKAKGKYLLFLNSDTVVGKGVLYGMIKLMEEKPEVGIATCALKNKDGSLQGTGGYFPTLIRVFSWMTIQDLPLVDTVIKPFHPMKDKMGKSGRGFYQKERELDWVTGAFMVVKRELIEAGLRWDESYFMYTEDVDFCFRAKKLGWKIMYTPKWSVLHFGGASGTREKTILGEFRGIKKFYRKHFPKWQMVPLRMILKAGALARMLVFGIIEGRESFEIYAKAFIEA